MVTRYIRQMDIFNPDDYPYGINIVGCGGIGSALGVILIKMGMSSFSLWDDDQIERHNLPNQFFNSGYLGSFKSSSLCRMMRDLRYQVSIVPIRKKLTPSCVLPYPITMVCTDSITSRRAILRNAIKSKCKLLIDGRMAGKVFKVFTVDLTKKKEIEQYKTSFHEDTEQSCTNRAIIFNIFGVASIMANQLTKVFKNEDYPREVNFCYQNNIIRVK